jgi:hypothetical protein
MLSAKAFSMTGLAMRHWLVAHAEKRFEAAHFSGTHGSVIYA